MELSAVLQQHGGVLWTTALAICVAAVVLAWFFPSLIPRTPVVGAAIAVAALLAGAAATAVADSLDRVIRGPRHVRATGGELVAVLPRDAAAEAARDLADAILDTRVDDAVVKVGLSAVSSGAFAIGDWADALGVALAGRGSSVLVLDLASGTLERDGAAEVAAGRRRFSDVAEIDRDLRLARLGPGRDPERALWGLPKLVSRLPADLDVLVVALPPAASRTTIEAMTVLDHALLVPERDRTSRVELLTALTAVARVREPAQVVLLDDPTAEAFGLTTATPAPAPTPARDPFGLAARHLLPPDGVANEAREVPEAERIEGPTTVLGPTTGARSSASPPEEPTTVLGPTAAASDVAPVADDPADTDHGDDALAPSWRAAPAPATGDAAPPASPQPTSDESRAAVPESPVPLDADADAKTRSTWDAELAPRHQRGAQDDGDEEPGRTDPEVMPEAAPVTADTPSDDWEPAAPRDVDLLLGVAAAEAAALADASRTVRDDTAEVRPVPEAGSAVDHDHPVPPDVEPHTMDAGSTEGMGDDEDPDDLLRTTAQMAILMDDLDERDQH